mgnify:FL=1
MKKIKNIILTLLIVFSLTFTINVHAQQSYTMSIDSPSTAAKGSNITLTFYAKNISSIKNGFSGYSGTINYDSTRLEFVSITSSISGWNIYKSNPENKITFLGYDDEPPANTKKSDVEIFKVVFKVKSIDLANTKIEVTNIKGSTSSGESLNASPVTKTITIKENSVTKSNNANLSGLSVNGYNITPTFNPNTTSYKLTVPNNVKKLTVNATAQDSKANISISGVSSLSVGKNNVIVEVKAEDGTKKTYVIEVTRKKEETKPSETNPSKDDTKKSDNNYLKNITGIPGLEFSKDKNNYDVTLPFDVSSINVGAESEDSKAKVSISNGNLKNLEVGKNNTITITVTAEDSSVKVYTINVKRSEYKSDTDLKELIVNDKDILKEGKDDYKIKVDKNTDKLDISAIPSSNGSTVKIKGDTTLKDGNNTVIVEVTDKNGFTKSYTIEVEKESNNFVLNFLKDYWLLLLALLLTLFIILLMLYLHRKNRKLLDDLEKTKIIKYSEGNVIQYPKEVHDNIDNSDIILYNSSNNMNDAYVPKHEDDGLGNNMVMQNVLNDESVSEVKKEVTIVQNGVLGNEEVEKEYKITENYRKKWYYDKERNK